MKRTYEKSECVRQICHEYYKEIEEAIPYEDMDNSPAIVLERRYFIIQTGDVRRISRSSEIVPGTPYGE